MNSDPPLDQTKDSPLYLTFFLRSRPPKPWFPSTHETEHPTTLLVTRWVGMNSIKFHLWQGAAADSTLFPSLTSLFYLSFPLCPNCAFAILPSFFFVPKDAEVIWTHPLVSEVCLPVRKEKESEDKPLNKTRKGDQLIRDSQLPSFPLARRTPSNSSAQLRTSKLRRSQGLRQIKKKRKKKGQVKFPERGNETRRLNTLSQNWLKSSGCLPAPLPLLNSLRHSVTYQMHVFPTLAIILGITVIHNKHLSRYVDIQQTTKT